MRNVTRILVAVSLLLAASVAAAETPEERGLAVAKTVDAYNVGFGSELSKMQMVLINAEGDRVERRMVSKVLEVRDDGDKSVVTFEWPADVKGTRMLTWSHAKGSDDQWLFLPSLQKVKRISARNQSGSFMGSEFAYEDLGSQEIEKYTHKLLGEETIGGRAVWVLERVPTYDKSGYSKQTLWIDKEYHQATKIDFYDRRGELLKTMTFSGHQQFGKYWRAGKIEVGNHQTHKRSELVWSERKLGESIDASEFDSENLDD